MHNIITTENILLIGALLLFVAVMAGKAAYRFGAPALLFFWGSVCCSASISFRSIPSKRPSS